MASGADSCFPAKLRGRPPGPALNALSMDHSMPPIPAYTSFSGWATMATRFLPVSDGSRTSFGLEPLAEARLFPISGPRAAPCVRHDLNENVLPRLAEYARFAPLHSPPNSITSMLSKRWLIIMFANWASMSQFNLTSNAPSSPMVACSLTNGCFPQIKRCSKTDSGSHGDDHFFPDQPTSPGTSPARLCEVGA